MKYHNKMFWFMTLHIKLWLIQKSLRIRFDKIDGFIRIYDGTRYLKFFDTEKYETISDRIIYQVYISRLYISVKSGIAISFLTILQKLKFILMFLCL